MSRILTISDATYVRLETAARMRGLSSIEQLLDMWRINDDELRYRQEVVRRIDALRERLFAMYGAMADSVELIRNDRER